MLPILLAGYVCGCASPVSTAVKLGAHVVGKVVADEETDQLGHKLIGRRPAEADAALGQRLDVLTDVNGAREWLVYPVKLDVMGQKRYVVEIARNQIIGVQLVERNAGKTDIPRKLVYEAKVKGKSPRDCEAALGLGPPVLTVRSVPTGQMAQLYDARLIKELREPHYCVLRFDSSHLCTQVDFMQVAAATE